MKCEITRCDVCGADDGPDNRVTLRIIGIDAPLKEPSDDGGFLISYFSGPRQKPSAHLDLCQACGGGLVAMLKEAQRHHEYEAANALPKPANKTFQHIDTQRVIRGGTL